MAIPGYAELIPVSEWIHLNDIVFISQTGTKPYKVTKINPKNLNLIDEDGKPWIIAERGAKKAPAGTEFNLKVALAEVTEGTVVEFTGNLAVQAGGPGPFVCIKAGYGANKSKYVRLNGDPERLTWNAFPNNVKVVTR